MNSCEGIDYIRVTVWKIEFGRNLENPRDEIDETNGGGTRVWKGEGRESPSKWDTSGVEWRRKITENTA